MDKCTKYEHITYYGVVLLIMDHGLCYHITHGITHYGVFFLLVKITHYGVMLLIMDNFTK